MTSINNGSNTNSKQNNSAQPKTLKLKTHIGRNLTSLGEKSHGLGHFYCIAYGKDILELPTEQNLRRYTGLDKPSSRTLIHKGVANTLDSEPWLLPHYNQGLTVTCSDLKLNTEKGYAIITDPGLINGAQTQGEIARFFGALVQNVFDGNPLEEPIDFMEAYNSARAELDAHPDIEIVVEFLVNQDSDQRRNAAIARNLSNNVAQISVSNAYGAFNDLAEEMKKANKDWKIQLNESDKQNADYLDTVLLLQVTHLITPDEITYPDGKVPEGAASKAYKGANSILKEFTLAYQNKDKDPNSKKRYEATVKLAPIAWSLFKDINTDKKWTGTGIQEKYSTSGKRVCWKNKSDNVIAFVNGISFPVMSAFRSFLKEKNGNYSIEIPDNYDRQNIYKAAIKSFGAFGYDPAFFGRSNNSYDVCGAHPEMWKQITSDLSSS